FRSSSPRTGHGPDSPEPASVAMSPGSASAPVTSPEPHWPQKRLAAGLSKPHERHVRPARATPHEPQNRKRSSFATPHDSQTRTARFSQLPAGTGSAAGGGRRHTAGMVGLP